jgi:hypothetical protein
MARPKNRADLRPEIQGALKRALMIMEQGGRPLSTIWVELFSDDPIAAMRLAISLLPKEVEVDVAEVTVDSTVVTDDALQAIFEFKRNESRQGDAEVLGSVH